MEHARRLAGFALLPALSMLASLVLLPTISSQFGSAAWIALAVGQSVGAIVSVIVSLAWPIIGGHLVANAATGPERQAIFRSSIASRLTMLFGLLVVAIPLTLLLTDQYRLETALFMVGIAFNGLTASWFYAGIGEPRHVVYNEGFVRLGAYAISLVGLLLGGGLVWYAAVMAVSGPVMLFLNWRQVMRGEPIYRKGEFRSGLATIASQVNGTTSRVLQALFSYGGPTVFSIVAPASLATYSALDQVQKAANNALGIAPFAFVSWVGTGEQRDRGRRMRRSMLVMVAIAVVALIFWYFLGSFILDYLFAGGLVVPPGGSAALIGTVVIVLICRSMELLVMVPLGFEKAIYNGNSVASVIGIALIAIGAITLGAVGGLLAWIVVHFGLIVYYSVLLLMSRRSQRS